MFRFKRMLNWFFISGPCGEHLFMDLRHIHQNISSWFNSSKKWLNVHPAPLSGGVMLHPVWTTDPTSSFRADESGGGVDTVSEAHALERASAMTHRPWAVWLKTAFPEVWMKSGTPLRPSPFPRLCANVAKYKWESLKLLWNVLCVLASQSRASQEIRHHA